MLRDMTYSQPDPAEETTADIEPEQPDTNTHGSESKPPTEPGADVQTDDEEAARDTTDDTEGGGQQ